MLTIYCGDGLLSRLSVYLNVCVCVCVFGATLLPASAGMYREDHVQAELAVVQQQSQQVTSDVLAGIDWVQRIKQCMTTDTAVSVGIHTGTMEALHDNFAGTLKHLIGRCFVVLEQPATVIRKNVKINVSVSLLNGPVRGYLA